MTVSENRQGIVLLFSHLLSFIPPSLPPPLPRSDGQLISDRVMGITTVLQKMGGQAGGRARDKGSTQDLHWKDCWQEKSEPTKQERD